jgi:hypothetical protein
MPQKIDPEVIIRTETQKLAGKRDYLLHIEGNSAIYIDMAEAMYLSTEADTPASSPLLTKEGAIPSPGDKVFWNLDVIIGRENGVLYT